MKKVVFLLATLLIGSMVFTGCKKDNNTPGDTTNKTFKVSYALENKATVEGVVITTDECFKFDVTYTGADGNPVKVLPCLGPLLLSM